MSFSRCCGWLAHVNEKVRLKGRKRWPLISLEMTAERSDQKSIFRDSLHCLSWSDDYISHPHVHHCAGENQ